MFVLPGWVWSLLEDGEHKEKWIHLPKKKKQPKWDPKGGLQRKLSPHSNLFCTNTAGPWRTRGISELSGKASSRAHLPPGRNSRAHLVKASKKPTGPCTPLPQGLASPLSRDHLKTDPALCLCDIYLQTSPSQAQQPLAAYGGLGCCFLHCL